MAREIHKRCKSAQRRSKGGNTPSNQHGTISRKDLFSRMSMEAMQAIDETRLEMRQQSPKEQAVREGTTAEVNGEKEAESKSAEESTNIKVSNVDDNDSAIGTCSMKSHPLVSADISGSPSPPDLPTREKTSEKVNLVDRVRPATVCAYRAYEDKNMAPKHNEFKYPEKYSQWIQEAISRHTPIASTLAQQNKKLNVFERLSAPAQISYKITARQRSRARLSLSLRSNRQESSPFSQKRDIHRDLSKSACPASFCISRTPESNNKTVVVRQEPHKLTTVTKTNEPAKQTPVITHIRTSNYLNKNSSYLKLGAQENNGRPDEPAGNKNMDSSSVGSLRVHNLHASRPFEITPLGYDSRYTTLRVENQPHHPDYSLDECEIIKESKMKCRQWLAQQKAVLIKF